MAQRARLKLNAAAITKAQRKGVNRGGRKAVEYLLAESREEVPHEEGTLERSGTASWDDSQMRGAVSYDTPYAIPQHERLDLRHDDGRKAKYLEDPFNRNRQVVAGIIAAEARRSLR